MIDKLKNKEKKLLAELIDVRKQIFDIKQQECFEKYGVKVGSVVEDIIGREYKVTRVTPYNNIKPSLKGRKRKKNGDFGLLNNYINSGRGEDIKVIEP